VAQDAANPRGREVTRRALCTLAALALLATSCGDDGSDEPPLPPRAKQLNLTAKEYRYDYRPPASPGRFVLRMRNAGGVRHEVIMVELPEGFPPIKEQLRRKKRRLLGTLSYLKPVSPGRTGKFAVDLKRARYAMVCQRAAPDGESHALKGMATEFRIR
jgi:hypothetical protein